ncbi:type IV secretory system conjugative DNA transfer family protein [Phenylobacterium sp.]|jgi:type IV secretion system protein VirD4|uniref:type IV secretory system conjugative DNA transfer family protein n=1 Tax=Phenylobacterium sp. TaxID=1871053 RepID=UPI002F3E3C31
MSRFASAPWPLRAAYVGALGAAAAALLAAMALTVALAGLKRLSPQLDAAAVPGWFWYFRHDPQVRRWLAIGLVAALLAAAGLAGAVVRGLQPPLHGAARWAAEPELRRAGFRARNGIVLGRKAGRLLSFGGPEHVLLYAPTRTGKGVGVVIPNLLTWPDSVVVLDVKRENWEASAGFRAAHGQAVFLFDPLEPQGRTARYNPLGHIRRDDPVEVLDELQKLAVMLFPTPDRADPFWTDAARTGFIAVGAGLAETAEAAFTLGAIYAELARGDARARLAAWPAQRAAQGRPLSPGCANALADFTSSSENTFASVKQTLTSRMNLWLNPRVCAATGDSDFDLRQLRSRRMSIYLAVSPDNLSRVAPLYSLVLQQLVELNVRERPQAGRHPVPVLVLLDEFARLGHAEVIAKAFAFVAGYGLRLLPVLQSPAQLRAEYGPDLAEEIIANCGAEVAFAPKELTVAQELAERLGAYTYQARSRNRPTLFSRGQSSTSESGQRRLLHLPQELIQMRPDQLIVLRAGLPPIRGRKIVYWREAAFTRRLQPPPTVAARAIPMPASDPGAAPSAAAEDPLRLALGDVLPALEAEGLGPLPDAGASPAEVEAWVDAFIDRSARQPEETDHGR